jgi:hypothetical protein
MPQSPWLKYQGLFLARLSQADMSRQDFNLMLVAMIFFALLAAMLTWRR